MIYVCDLIIKDCVINKQYMTVEMKSYVFKMKMHICLNWRGAFKSIKDKEKTRLKESLSLFVAVQSRAESKNLETRAYWIFDMEEGWSLGKLVLAKEVVASLSVGADIKDKVGAFRISWC